MRASRESHLRIVREAGRLRLEAAAQRSLPAALILALWLVGWGFGEAIALRQLFFTDAPVTGSWFLGLWLLLWTGGGLLAAGALLRSLGAREVIAVEGRTLTLRPGPFGRTRRFDVDGIRALRLDPVVPAVTPFPPLDPEVVGQQGRDPGRPAAVAFDSGGRSWRFGAGLPDAELAQARAALAERLPAALAPRAPE